MFYISYILRTLASQHKTKLMKKPKKLWQKYTPVYKTINKIEQQI